MDIDDNSSFYHPTRRTAVFKYIPKRIKGVTVPAKNHAAGHADRCTLQAAVFTL